MRKLETDNAIVTETYGVAEEISLKLEVGITTKLDDCFQDGLSEDTFGKMLGYKIDADGTEQVITLIYFSRAVKRWGGDDKDQSKTEKIRRESLPDNLNQAGISCFITF